MPAWLRKLVTAALVVPDAQVRVLDVDYQLYAYELFHRDVVNRWVHALGIPLAACALASALVGTPWALPCGLALGVLHAVLAMRARAPSLLFALAPIHAGIWLFGEHVTGPFLAWAHVPVIAVVIGCATLQYLAHARERDVPVLAFGGEGWTDRDSFFRRTPLRSLLLAIVLAPFHVAVELVSSPRNLFLLVLAGARGMGLCPRHVEHTHAKIPRAARVDFDDVDAVTARTGMRGHGQAQLANDVLVAELARRTRVETVGYGPGAVDTEIRRELPRWVVTLLRLLFAPWTRSPEQVADDLATLARDAARGPRWLDRGHAFEPDPFVTDPARGRALWEVSEALVRKVLGSS